MSFQVTLMNLANEVWMSSELLLSNKLSWLLILGPIALVGDYTGFLGEAMCFALSGIALIPCAERYVPVVIFFFFFSLSLTFYYIISIYFVDQPVICHRTSRGTYQWDDWSLVECDLWKCSRIVDCDGRPEIRILSSRPTRHVGKYVDQSFARLWNVLFGRWDPMASPRNQNYQWKCIRGDVALECHRILASRRIDSFRTIEK